MNILFLMLNLSDLGKPSGMYSDLITEFSEKGHTVYPVATALSEGPSKVSIENGIKVLRVNTLPLFNVNSIRKGIANVMLPFQYKTAIRNFYKGINFDVIIIPTPPITLVSLVKPLKKKHNAVFYLILRDIFPQNAVDLGMMRKGGLLHRYFRKQEKSLYACADSIGCMSQGNIDYIVKHDPEVPVSKLHILMNFQKPAIKTNQNLPGIKEKYGFRDKFVVVFGGNMGVPQKIENVIALCKECMIFKDVVFLFIGEGRQRIRIENIATENNIKNIIFNDFIPRDEYLQLIRQCDIGLISLNEKFTIPNFPSKSMSYFDAEIPILAAVDSSTDYGAIIEKAGAGLVSQAGDTVSFFNNFKKLYASPELRSQMGKNGKKFLEQNMTSEIAFKTIVKNVQALR